MYSKHSLKKKKILIIIIRHVFKRSIQNEFPQTQIKINQIIGMIFFHIRILKILD